MDKTTRLSVINEYEKGGLEMIDLETMITSLRLAWFKRIFGINDGAWKDYLRHQLINKRFGGLFLFHCNYNVKDHPIPSQFYTEIFKWWAEFRDMFSTEKCWHSIIWNNQDVHINKAPLFYKTFFESYIVCISDLLFHLNNLDSYNIISKHNFIISKFSVISQGTATRNNTDCNVDICHVNRKSPLNILCEYCKIVDYQTQTRNCH